MEKVTPTVQNKDQVIYQLRQEIRSLENKVSILEKNVRDEVELSHTLMQKLGHTAHEAQET